VQQVAQKPAQPVEYAAEVPVARGALVVRG
jgi:hypothetical protein